MTTDVSLPRAPARPQRSYPDRDPVEHIRGQQRQGRGDYEQVAARHDLPQVTDRSTGRHAARFGSFSVIEVVALLAGLTAQASMASDFHEPSALSYAARIVVSVEASFLLNRWLTWRKRGTAFWLSFWRYNHQRVITVAAELLLFAGLLRLDVDHGVASVSLLAVFTIVNYIGSDRFIFTRAAATAEPLKTTSIADYSAAPSAGACTGCPPIVYARDHQHVSAPVPPARSRPTVGVVIPCRGNQRTIRATVESLLRQDYPELQQIILIGSPMDTTWEGLEGIYDRRLRIQEVVAPPGDRGASFKRDFGIRESSSEIVSFIDSDMVLPRDWLSRAVTRLNETAVGSATRVAQSSHDLLDRFVDRRHLGAKTRLVEATTGMNGVGVRTSDLAAQTGTGQRAVGAHARHLPPTRAYSPPYGLQTRPGSDRVPRPEPRSERGLGPAVASPLRAPVDPRRCATPPSDAEKYQYLQGGQKRWFIALQYLAFLGVVTSFAGFTASTYETLIFSIPLLVFVVEQTLALYTSTRRRRIDLASHRYTVENWAPQRYPSVDVFVPTAGEELDVLDNTMRHLNLLEWPGELRVYILDDSGRASVRQLAAKHGFAYLARPGSEYKKAGNLRYGAERTRGEIIAIFDTDFVPRRDFLFELVPYMDDPDVGIVQSPQFFDTTKQMNWIQRCAGSTQELFYRFIQPSRDALGAAVCVGTSALYRRAALDAIGGIPKLAQSEDIYTGLWMLDAGYSIRYVPVAASKGIAPDNVDNFIAQQYRWCEGSMTMLVTRHFHTTAHLSLSARLCFWSGFLYYVSTALSSLIIPLPAIVMAWFYPEWVRPWNTIWLAGALVSWLVLYPMVMRSRWRIDVLRLQTVYGFAHIFNIVHLVRNQVAEWHPTGSRAPAPIAVQVKRFYTAYLGLTLSVGAVGLILRASEDGFTLFAGMLVFFTLNLYVVGPLVFSGIRDEVRSHRRAHAAETATEVPVGVAA